MGCAVRPLGSGEVCRVSARDAEPTALQDWGLNRRAACGATPGRSARWSFEGKGGALGVRARRSEAFRVHLRACVCSRANAELLRLWHHLGALRVDGRALAAKHALLFAFSACSSPCSLSLCKARIGAHPPDVVSGLGRWSRIQCSAHSKCAHIQLTPDVSCQAGICRPVFNLLN